LHFKKKIDGATLKADGVFHRKPTPFGQPTFALLFFFIRILA
jgi:hypothetical protein